MSPGNAYKGVTRWYSPSNSYIQIDSFKQPVACGKDFQLDILYSTPSDTNYNFYVMVSFQISNLLFFSIDKNRRIDINFDHFCPHFHRWKYRNYTFNYNFNMLILDNNNVMVTVLCFMAQMTVVSSNVTFFQNGRKYQKWKPPKQIK